MTESQSPSPDRRLPMLVDAPVGAGLGPGPLVSWCRGNVATVRAALLREGAILFRGFGITDEAGFAHFARAIGGSLGEYAGGNSPRTRLEEGIYTSTEYPARLPISLHNELSFAANWPALIMFGCVQPAEQGGETPLADGRRVLRALPDPVIEAFGRRGVMYLRHLHGGQGLGPSWRQVFLSEDRGEVERLHRGSFDAFQWTADGGLRLTSIRRAIIEHPDTGEAVWFNQAEQFHPSGLDGTLGERLRAAYSGREDHLPQNARFGDGTEIPETMLQAVRAALDAERVQFAWRRGDLLLIDNRLVLHGRMPYKGSRLVLVAMVPDMGWFARDGGPDA
jgi:alpha-ketoglutarate-dependent taurine dioxygenase